MLRQLLTSLAKAKRNEIDLIKLFDYSLCSLLAVEDNSGTSESEGTVAPLAHSEELRGGLLYFQLAIVRVVGSGTSMVQSDSA